MFQDIAYFQQLSVLVVTDSKTKLDLTTDPGRRRTLFSSEAIWDVARQPAIPANSCPFVLSMQFCQMPSCTDGNGYGVPVKLL